ncbi:hypothetical protein QR680_013441 [Steinernema hermaphroditum]|uniref:SKP1 component POZ domain-containing protein n=1 Tax=Steinernema hermaphroditum TaxID=289476 RepID=A0AA39I5I7_9BILA|nr:hypothetical protein QR680_013441 [Steinernema hermaphroditum]
MDQKYTLISSDGESIEVVEEVLLESRTLSDLVEGCGGVEPIPLPQVDAETARLVFVFCELKHKKAFFVREKTTRSVTVEQDDPELSGRLLYKRLYAANFLEVATLCGALCSYVALRFIKGKTPEQIRNLLLHQKL